MPEAVISYVGEMPYRPGGVVDLHPFVPCFEAKVGGEPLFKVWVQLSFEGSFNATRQLEVQGLSEAAITETISRALLLYGTRRLELLVTEWLEINSKPVNPSDVWDLTTENVQELLALIQRKTCGSQLKQGRNLYCTAAATKDPSISREIDSQRVSPTSTPLCNACKLPDDRYLCSSLIHPQVAGLISGTGYARTLQGALCDQGQRDNIKRPDRCFASGNKCWHRIVEVEPSAAPPVSPLELAEAFDVLDAVWRLAFDKKKPLLSLSTAATPAALSLGCATRAEFETRISDLADLIDRIKVDDALLRPRSDEELTGSLNRMDDCLHHKLPAAHHAAVDRAIRTLRTIRQARNAEQHGITEGGGLTAKLRALGIHDAPPNWGGAWDVVRARAVEALTSLRHELMKWVDSNP
ncbi:hypothetical protein [Streptosporangium sp. NPDC023615]|uniref:hypothetical protein n=1 Tax=Streptosporangium sp. NPDC023615 TaxID=3154794 RepID=UPI003440C52D